MKKLITIVSLLFTLSTVAQAQKDSLVDMYDRDHKIIKLKIHVNDLLEEMNNQEKDIYYIRQTKRDGTIVECLYTRRFYEMNTSKWKYKQ